MKYLPNWLDQCWLLQKCLNDVTLTVNVMFGNGLKLFVTRFRGMKPLTIEFLPSHSAEQLCSHLTKVMCLYDRGGFLVQTAFISREFECSVDKSDDILISTPTARDHVGNVELDSLKIGMFCLRYLSFHSEPVYDMPLAVALWIKVFPRDNGAPAIYLIHEIVTGLCYQKRCWAL